jgi:cobalt-zinc-cadmium efflux system membrane fusion protein
MKLTPSLALRLAGAVFCAAFSGCTRHPSPSGPDPAPGAKITGDKITFPAKAPQLGYLAVEPAQERKAVATALNGRLVWDDDVTSRVFTPVSGRVVEIVARLGQPVGAGDALATIRSPDFGQAQADARKALTDFTLAARTLARVRDLAEHHAAAQKDVEAAEADYTRAVSEKERALANLSLYGGDANAAGVNGIFSLKAPVDGVVVDKSVNPGQEVRGDQVGDKPLFVISKPERLWLFLDVTETEVAALAAGQEVLVHARALPEKTFHGRVDVIGEGLDPATRTIKARCIVDNPEKLLRAEMYVNAEVVAGKSAGVDVATKAIFAKDTQHYLFVETAPGQFERRAVRIGLETNGRSVVVEGLAAGERVVTEGALLLQAMLEGESS